MDLLQLNGCCRTLSLCPIHMSGSEVCGANPPKSRSTEAEQAAFYSFLSDQFHCGGLSCLKETKQIHDVYSSIFRRVAASGDGALRRRGGANAPLAMTAVGKRSFQVALILLCVAQLTAGRLLVSVLFQAHEFFFLNYYVMLSAGCSVKFGLL